MTVGGDDSLETRVAAWLDDLAAHEAAVEHITALGHDAIEPLTAYLGRGPQTISQARELAVQLLARLHDVRVTAALREVLYAHPLHALPPYLQESEFRVKNAALTALAAADGQGAADAVDFGLRSEHLPAAVLAAGTLGLCSLASALAGLLADDVLADAAAGSLRGLGETGSEAVIAHLAYSLDTDAPTSRDRRIWLRACLCLVEMRVCLALPLLERLMANANLLVRAAAALHARGDSAVVLDALAAGSLVTDVRLAAACRAALERRDDAAWVQAALHALQRETLPDVYGHRQPPDPAARYWLIRRMLPQMATDPANLRALVAVTAPVELALALRHGAVADLIPAVPDLLAHADETVRLAAILIVARHGDSANRALLFTALRDSKHRVRRRAWRVLLRLSRSPAGTKSLKMPVAVALRHPCGWWRLRPRRHP